MPPCWRALNRAWARLSTTQKQQIIHQTRAADLPYLAHDWALQARAKQCPPDGAWRIWLLLAGRGFGKTRTGAEWLSYLARHCPDLSLAIVGATFDDARYVMVEGPSGILAASDFYGAPDWAPSKRLLRWSNGTVARLYAAEAPRQLRGPEFHYVADPPHWLHAIGQAVLRHYHKTASLMPECLFHQAGQEVG